MLFAELLVLFAIQIKICAEYRDMLPRAGLSGNWAEVKLMGPSLFSFIILIVFFLG